MKKKITAPFVSQGILSKTDAGQGRAFREAADSFRYSTQRVASGKGIARRPGNGAYYREFDRIFRKGGKKVAS